MIRFRCLAASNSVKLPARLHWQPRGSCTTRTGSALSWQRQTKSLSRPLTRQFVTSGSYNQSDLPLRRPGGKPHPPPVQEPVRHRRRIRTLNPDKLTSNDYVDLSSTHLPYFRVILHSDSPDPPAGPRFVLAASSSEWSSAEYPPNTRGFLYYHVPSNGSPLAGELRFRLTSSRDPLDFATGSDLQTESGVPWSYPLYKIVWRPDYQDITTLLLQDGLVSRRTLELTTMAVASLQSSAEGATDSSDMLNMTLNTLSAFGQEFVYRLGGNNITKCLFIGPDTIVRQDAKHFTSFQVSMGGKYHYVQYYPFEGSVIAAFERSTLPEHAGKRFVVLRVVRFVKSDPVRAVPAPNGLVYPADALRPHEGELVNTMVRSKVRPWAVNVDKGWKTRRGLKLLFDNEELSGASQESQEPQPEVDV